MTLARLARAAPVALVMAAAGCHRAGPPAPPPPPTSPPAGAAGAERGEAEEAEEASLPDAPAGFVASPTVTGAGYVRRTYTRAATRIDVTLARSPMAPGAFEAWLAMSRQGFPQAALDAPADDANGFYQCDGKPAPRCDLLIQLRSGVHVEIRGGGTSSRADVDALARALPLRRLTRRP